MSETPAGNLPSAMPDRQSVEESRCGSSFERAVDAVRRTAHFETTLHYLAALARRKRIVTSGELLEEITRALRTAPTDPLPVAAWQPIGRVVRREGTMIVADCEDGRPHICVWRDLHQGIRTQWWSENRIIHPARFFYMPPNSVNPHVTREVQP